MKYNEVDVVDISVAYSNVIEQQSKLLKMSSSDSYFERSKAVEEMRNRIKRYKEVTNESLQTEFRGRGIRLEMLESMCEKLSEF